MSTKGFMNIIFIWKNLCECNYFLIFILQRKENQESWSSEFVLLICRAMTCF